MDVVCALIIKEGKILGTRRSSLANRAGKWEFPGGKVRQGEKPENALIREIDEELGIAVSVIHRFPHLVYDYPEISIRLIPFICKWVEGDIRLKDHDQYAWILRENLSNYDWSGADGNLILLIQNSTELFNGNIV